MAAISIRWYFWLRPGAEGGEIRGQDAGAGFERTFNCDVALRMAPVEAKMPENYWMVLLIAIVHQQ